MIISAPSFSVIRFKDEGFKDGSFLVTSPMLLRWKRKRCVITVEQGFITNFASVPSLFRSIFPVNGLHRLPALVHDYLYSKAGQIEVFYLLEIDGSYTMLDEPVTIHYTKQEADFLFYEFMLDEGVNKYTACLMYRAVTLFGHTFWGAL